MKENQNQIDFQNTVSNIDEVDMQENKINPQFYIHNCIINIQNSLSAQSGDIKSGILRYMLGVEQLEGLLRAKNGLSLKYVEDLNKYETSPEFEKVSGNLYEGIQKKDYKLCSKKYELLLAEIFANTKIIKPSKI